MDKTIAVIVVAGTLLTGVWARAEGGCCAAGKTAGTNTAQMAACTDVFSKLNLTDEQKTKLNGLTAEATKAGWSTEAHAKFMKGVEELLTPAQRTELKAACDKMSKGAQCPFKSDGKS